MTTKTLYMGIADPEKIDKDLPGVKINPASDGRTIIDVDLNQLVMDVDSALIEEGYEPFQRPLHACARIAERLGTSFTIGSQQDPFVETVHMVYNAIYRPSDLYMPPMHIGTVMFRDTFLPLRIPVVYGEVAVNPVKCLHEVPENVIKWIYHNDATAHTFMDQWIDLFDFVYGIDDVSKLKKHKEQSIEFWQLAKQQLEGAAATLLGSIDKYTVIQNSIIAMELLLKGVLCEHGIPEKKLRNYSHDMPRLVEKACELMPKADKVNMAMVINRTPKLIERRYQAKEYKRTELGQIMMDAQYVAGEVLRQFTDRDIRTSLTSNGNEDYSKRYYPFSSYERSL